ncbi:uncharacterized protein LOC130591943 [Beta vulgaris subsp. vulgaris]|uniref:uncharacterized protein LOC130591943 n=1 Tax=Beta vulgaris subsp. vulgaris TaxID=3555 RepID=UPI00254985BC|nr:uncharacterized protein LOC130591943 [Beta vulgaris subsp. vulgaris]
MGEGDEGGYGKKGKGHRKDKVNEEEEGSESWHVEEEDEDEEVNGLWCKSGKGGRLPDEVYRVNKLSVGGRLKESGEVIASRVLLNNKREVNFNCRVETFGQIVKQFDERKKRLVAEMGFAGLLHFVDKGLPRNLCYWLCTMVDVKRRVLVVNGLEFPLSKIQVHWVLGIPIGPRHVPKVCEDDAMENEVARLCESFVTRCPSGPRGVRGRQFWKLLRGLWKMTQNSRRHL